MDKEKFFRSAGSDMTVSLSKSRENDSFIKTDHLSVFAAVFLYTFFVAHIGELALRNRKCCSAWIFLISRINIAIDNKIPFQSIKLLYEPQPGLSASRLF